MKTTELKFTDEGENSEAIFPDFDPKKEIDFETIIDLCFQGIHIDSSHHKSWYLLEILKLIAPEKTHDYLDKYYKWRGVFICAP